MSNQVYDAAKSEALAGGVNWVSDDHRVVLVDLNDYTFAPAHTSLSDIPVAARVAVSGPLSGRVVNGSNADCDNPTISNVSGDPLEAVVVYQHTGVESTSTLRSFHDTEDDGTTAISFIPNGSDVVVSFPDGGPFGF